MSGRISHALPAAIVGACLMAFASASAADPLWFVEARAESYATAVDGLYQRYMPVHGEDHFVNPNDFQPMQVSSYSGSTSSLSRGTISYDPATGKTPSLQAADSAASLYTSIGGLRAAATADNTVSDYTGPQQFVGGSAGAIMNWVDTLTFHTANPLGADFQVTLSLDYDLSTSLVPSFVQTNGYALYPGQTTAHSQIHTLLAMFAAGGPSFSASDNFLHIEDSVDQNADHRDPVTGLPQITLTPPPSRTLGAIVHIFDGTTIRFEQDLDLQASINDGNGTAAANASDTAWMNLVALDDGASYSAASGTVFATSGDPFATGTVAPVPEPSDFALVGAGLGVLAFVARRRRHDRV